MACSRTFIFICSLLVVGVGVVYLAAASLVTVDGSRALAGGSPTATPKPGTSGSLSGVYDGLVSPYAANASEDGAGPNTCGDSLDNGGDTQADILDAECRDKAQGLHHCILRADHDGSTNAAKAAAICYIDTPGLSLGSAVPERADGVPSAPPPPPYTTASPTKLTGSYNPGTDTLSLSGCFANIGTSLGPNAIVVASLPKAKASLPNLRGTVLIYGDQSISECDSLIPGGPTPSARPLNLTRVASGRDFDGDGCSDADELSKPSTPGMCGNDPYNPHDSNSNFDSIVNALVTVERADSPTRGSYFHCVADVQHTKSGTLQPLTVRTLCYTDDPAVTVNYEAAGNVSLCQPLGSAPPSQCGDGRPDSPPPAPYADVDSTHAQLTGTYDTSTGVISVAGCFQGIENPLQGPSVYVSATIDAKTGRGTVRIWLRQSSTDCKSGTPVHTKTSQTGPNGPRQIDCGEAPNEQDPQPCLIEIAEQAPRTASWDLDLDYCPDRLELGANAMAGGLRDPLNRWDWMDQFIGGSKDGAITVGDVGAVASRFGSSGTPGDPKAVPSSPTGYHTGADRSGALAGSNGWNLKPPDGAITVGDIGAVQAQFGHAGCNPS